MVITRQLEDSSALSPSQPRVEVDLERQCSTDERPQVLPGVPQHDASVTLAALHAVSPAQPGRPRPRPVGAWADATATNSPSDTAAREAARKAQSVSLSPSQSLTTSKGSEQNVQENISSPLTALASSSSDTDHQSSSEYVDDDQGQAEDDADDEDLPDVEEDEEETVHGKRGQTVRHKPLVPSPQAPQHLARHGQPQHSLYRHAQPRQHLPGTIAVPQIHRDAQKRARPALPSLSRIGGQPLMTAYTSWDAVSPIAKKHRPLQSLSHKPDSPAQASQDEFMRKLRAEHELRAAEASAQLRAQQQLQGNSLPAAFCQLRPSHNAAGSAHPVPTQQGGSMPMHISVSALAPKSAHLPQPPLANVKQFPAPVTGQPHPTADGTAAEVRKRTHPPMLSASLLKSADFTGPPAKLYSGRTEADHSPGCNIPCIDRQQVEQKTEGPPILDPGANDELPRLPNLQDSISDLPLDRAQAGSRFSGDALDTCSASPTQSSMASQEQSMPVSQPSSKLSKSSSKTPPVRLYASSHKVSMTRYATSTDPRGYIPVFEYPLNGQTIMIDCETGFVHFTGIWKALGHTKADVVKLIESSPEISASVRKVRGGYLKIQGTWLPYDTALSLARRVAFSIRDDLVPLFGPAFPSSCLMPGQPGFGQLLLSQPRNRGASRRKDSPRQSATPPQLGASNRILEAGHASFGAGRITKWTPPHRAYGIQENSVHLQPAYATHGAFRAFDNSTFSRYGPPHMAAPAMPIPGLTVPAMDFQPVGLRQSHALTDGARSTSGFTGMHASMLPYQDYSAAEYSMQLPTMAPSMPFGTQPFASDASGAQAPMQYNQHRMPVPAQQSYWSAQRHAPIESPRQFDYRHSFDQSGHLAFAGNDPLRARQQGLDRVLPDAPLPDLRRHSADAVQGLISLNGSYQYMPQPSTNKQPDAPMWSQDGQDHLNGNPAIDLHTVTQPARNADEPGMQAQTS
ncbi:uncharacterized protein L969DRAFT_204943 [Mixia osmundae IAM 14324]|uniref:uncharacterized protein n=1 Tax=Mixia osmundae (strain CBS 9802 / IAM 14324 / JCM 22182 / KY 12970) TaxID=764103 RepID=UPI0004A555A3|nr:uncharacterized protein L969DRAFT_204943 [Mixia osmundae IAM 14324]KEI37010.1 hypothetical protein L969DRAFT_204943 [Mixia osmundae IAM 14324]